ncbi:hypothetical protein SEA_DATBOI_161 [Gordonia phage DatBoi]|nr:hypothetical protein SEA_DATBOI_161 [Gordonia phage DatBoi]
MSRLDAETLYHTLGDVLPVVEITEAADDALAEACRIIADEHNRHVCDTCGEFDPNDLSDDGECDDCYRDQRRQRIKERADELQEQIDALTRERDRVLDGDI